MKRLLYQLHRREEGVTGIETAIIIIGFVIVAAVFAFVVLGTGLFSADRGRETILAGLDKARGSIEVRGAVTVTDVNTDGAITAAGADTIEFSVGNAAAGTPVNLDEAAASNRTVINYIDAQGRAGDATYAATELQGDGDDLLEQGELFSVSVVIPAGASLVVNERFTVEIVPPNGGTSLIHRTMPQAIDTVMDLR
jgi:flagellin FlaB